MRFFIVAALALTGCGHDKAPAEPEAARPTVDDPIGFCARARVVMMGRRKCFPEDTSITMALDEISELERGAPADPAARRHVAAKCARMLDGMIRAEPPKNCPLDVTDDERHELSAFLALKP